MKILDDLLPEPQFRAVQSIIMGESFPWYYGARTYGRSDDHLTGWTHTVLSASSRVVYSQNRPLYQAALDMLKAAGENPQSIMRIRILANTTVLKPYLRGVHVDYPFPHSSAVFYVNDADGDTIIYKDRYAEDKDVPVELEVMASVKPKANRAVFFDGLHYHSGTLPTVAARRVVININYIKGEQHAEYNRTMEHVNQR